MPRKKTTTPANNAGKDVNAGDNAGQSVVDEGPAIASPGPINVFEQMEREGLDLASDDDDNCVYCGDYPCKINCSRLSRKDLVRQFNRCDGTDLPDPGHGVGTLADIFFESGYFGDLTPAQIATTMILGSALGLGPAIAAADIEVLPGPVVRYKTGTPILELAELAKTRNADPATPEGPLAAGNADKGVRVVRFADGRPLDDVVIDEKDANKGPVLVDDDGNGERPAPGPETLPGVNQDEKPADLSDSIPADVGISGDDVPKVVETWRSGLANMCKELGIDVNEKLSTFDVATIAGKRDMFEKCQGYYLDKLAASTSFVLEALANDGKRTLDEQKGFFLYAEVGTDPTCWTLTEAKKAESVVGQFIGPPAAA